MKILQKETKETKGQSAESGSSLTTPLAHTTSDVFQVLRRPIGVRPPRGVQEHVLQRPHVSAKFRRLDSLQFDDLPAAHQQHRRTGLGFLEQLVEA